YRSFRRFCDLSKFQDFFFNDKLMADPFSLADYPVSASAVNKIVVKKGVSESENDPKSPGDDGSEPASAHADDHEDVDDIDLAGDDDHHETASKKAGGN